MYLFGPYLDSGLIPYIAKSQLHRMLFAGRNISNGLFLFAEILLLVMISS